MSLKVQFLINLQLPYNLFRRILIHHRLVMRVPFQRLIPVPHLPLKSLPIPLIPYPVQYVLARRLVPPVPELNRIHLVLLRLLRLYRVDYLVRVDSCQLVGERLHELVPPVFAGVSVEGTRVVLGQGRLTVVVIFHIPHLPSNALVGVETVVGVQAENVGLVGFL